MSYDPVSYWNKRHHRYAGWGNGENSPRSARSKLLIAHTVRMVRAEAAKDLLDLGCGAGRMSEAILRCLSKTNDLPVRWTGIDLSRAATQAARVRLGSDLLCAACCFDAAKPWPSRLPMHDITFCFDVLFHAGSQERHDAIVDNMLRHTRKAALICTWKSSILDAYPAMASHNSYFPFTLPLWTREAAAEVTHVRQIPAATRKAAPHSILYIVRFPVGRL